MSERPYIVCHMMASLDGRIDCGMTEQIPGTDAYYEALDFYDLDATFSGKVTAVMHMAEPGTYVPADPSPVGENCWHKAVEDDCWTVVADTRGSLIWKDNMVDEQPLVVVLSQQAPGQYLDYLEDKQISYIVSGKDSIDLAGACRVLADVFGVRRLGIVGGGHINGSFLRAGLVDEVSMVYGPAIDGREGRTAAFDGAPDDSAPVQLELKRVRQYDDGAVWMRYKVK